MRNDIKRFFVAVLAACGLAVSAANVAAVPLTLIPESGDARCAIVVDPAVMASGSSTPGFNDSAWPTTDVALQTWSSLGLHNHMGSMWYRTTIDVAQPQSGKTVWLWVERNRHGRTALPRRRLR